MGFVTPTQLPSLAIPYSLILIYLPNVQPIFDGLISCKEQFRINKANIAFFDRAMLRKFNSMKYEAITFHSNSFPRLTASC